MPSSRHNSAPTNVPERRFLSRADALLIMGMVLLVFSLFLTWKQEPLALPANAQAIFVVGQASLDLRGFDLPLWKWMVGCGVVCNLLLLWNPTPQNRQMLAVLQGIAGLGALLLTLRYLSGEIGSILGLVAGLLLAWGALNRYQEITQVTE